MTLDQAKNLKKGNYVHHVEKKNADGTPVRYRVTSVKTWKTRPNEILVGLKYGLKGYTSAMETDLHLIDLGRGD